jgi:hypothetical protein
MMEANTQHPDSVLSIVKPHDRRCKYQHLILSTESRLRSAISRGNTALVAQLQAELDYLQAEAA